MLLNSPGFGLFGRGKTSLIAIRTCTVSDVGETPSFYMILTPDSARCEFKLIADAALIDRRRLSSSSYRDVTSEAVAFSASGRERESESGGDGWLSDGVAQLVQCCRADVTLATIAWAIAID